MRVLPHMTVLSPVDSVETVQMVRAMCENKGPCYIRINRNDLPIYTNSSDAYHIGQMKHIRDGSDVVVFATGVMVSQAVQAAENLEKEKISVRVVNVSTIKPLDVKALEGYCAGVKGVVTTEEHSIYGGMGSAVCEALSASTKRLPVVIHGINDSFGCSAENYGVLLEKYNLTPEAIADKVKEALNK
jgi:transketolase